MYDFPREPLGIGQQLDQAFRLTRYVYPKIWGVLGIMMAVGALNGLAFSSFDPQSTDIGATTLIAILLFALISIFLYFLLIVRICYAAFGLGDTSDAIMTALRKLPPLIVLYIGLTLAITVGMLLLVVPGLILMISLSLCMYIMVLENKGPIESLRRSHSLVWGGNWWRTAAILTVGGIIMLVLLLLIGVVLVVPVSVADPQTAELITTVINSVVSPLIYPFFFAIGLVVFNDVRIRKEGADVEALIADL